MADDVKVKIGAEDKASAKIKGIGKSTEAMSKKFKMAGVAMVAMGTGLVLAMGKMINTYSKAGDEVAKMAKRTGWGTVALSELRHAANLSGASLDDVEKSTKRMARAVVEAQDGVLTYVDAFDKIGVNVKELEGMKPEEQFWTIAGALADLEDHTLKVAVAQDIFGRSGTNLIPLLDSGKEAIIEMRDEAHALNLVFSEEAAKAAEDFEDAKTRLTGALTGIGATIGKALMPHLENLITSLTEKLKPAIEWLSAHPEWIKWSAVASGIMLVGGAIMLIVPKVIALISAMVVLHGLMGPAGWIKMAAGLAIAAAAIAGLGYMAKKAMTPLEEITWTGKGPPPPPPPGKRYVTPGSGVPSMQYGGIVPGPVGQPRLIVAHGGEPVGRAVGGPTVVVHVHGNVMAERDLAATIREELLKIKSRNVTTGL